MQSFELPDFYVPWPARLNPNLDAARAHSKLWAREMGILDAPQADSIKTWDERTFDRHDYTLLCAYIHPEAPLPELNLMTDWNVWAFYVDDYFLQVYKQSKDRAGAKEYLDRVLVFMPVDLSPLPVPNNPTECALADLWLRTAPTKSEAWRCRIVEDTKNLLDAFLWELDSVSQQRLANPIEYIEMRRQVGAALWSADLVEHAMFVEIPERIAATRTMQVLKNTFADGVHLRNDIFSYEREVVKGGELTNAILVVERFMDVDTQRAAKVVNDLLTARLQRFEHIVLTELAAIFQEYALDSLEQANVLTYIRGLQDWQSGAHEWHIQTSRYLNPSTRQISPTTGGLFACPTGLGTAAMRITPDSLGLQRFKNYRHIPYKIVGPTCLPKFYMPFTVSMSPHLDDARQHSKSWARQMGMFDSLPDHPDVFIFDEHRFDVTDLAFFSALFRSSVSAEQLNLELGWVVWGTYTDDYIPLLYGRTHNLAGAKLCVARLWEFMPVEPDAPTPIPITPVERGLADLWARATVNLSIDERYLFRKVIQGMVGSWVLEIPDRIQNRIPDPIDYIELRRKTSGSDQLMIFSRTINYQDIPAEVHRTLTMQELANAAIDYVCFTNDVISYQKEIECEGEIHNVVLVIENFFGCEKIEAVEIVNSLMTARAKQVEHIVATELPLLFENFNLNAKAREQLLAYAKDLQNYMCASLQWHLRTDRYREIEFRRSAKPFLGASKGLGTSAVHILELVTGIQTIASVLTQEEAPRSIKPFADSHLTPFFDKKKEEEQMD